MGTLFDDRNYEPSRLVAFAGNTLERRSEERAEDCLAQAFAQETARAYVTTGDKLLFKAENDPLFALGELDAWRVDRAEAILLGYAGDGSPRLFLRTGVTEKELGAKVRVVGFRTVFAEGILPPDRLGEFAQGASLLAWNVSSRFCGRCGAATEPAAGGHRHRCPSCERELFPRSDPAVIMLGIDERHNRCLLGRSPHFRPSVYSCLAGFVEPGETIEAAVRRETHEEAGITLGRVRYHASQPWPFPHSLMIGCYGEALTQQINRDEAELEGCRWFGGDEVGEMLRGTSDAGYKLPYKGSIAYRLIADWHERIRAFE